MGFNRKTWTMFIVEIPKIHAALPNTVVRLEYETVING